MEARIAKDPALQRQHEKVVRELTAKGYKPTTLQVVRITTTEPTLLQRAVNLVSPTLYAQVHSDPNIGETDVSPWDSGNNNVFTGEALLIDYGSDGWGDGTMAFDVSSEGSFHLISANGDVGPGPVGAGGARYWDALYDWSICTVSGCAGALTACWISGPAWGQCAIAWCGGAEVSCAVSGILNHIRHRQG
jgi:hypothetical protein